MTRAVIDKDLPELMPCKALLCRALEVLLLQINIDAVHLLLQYPAMRFFKVMRIRKLAAVAALAVLLGQFALILHDAVAQHDVNAACEICIVKDKLADSVVSFFASPVFFATIVLVGGLAFQPLLARRVQAARPRGPPVL